MSFDCMDEEVRANKVDKAQERKKKTVPNPMLYYVFKRVPLLYK